MWPELDSNIVTKNYPIQAMATVKVHMKKERKRLQSTKKQPPPQTIKTKQEEKESNDRTLYYFHPLKNQISRQMEWCAAR